MVVGVGYGSDDGIADFGFEEFFFEFWREAIGSDFDEYIFAFCAGYGIFVWEQAFVVDDDGVAFFEGSWFDNF